MMTNLSALSGWLSRHGYAAAPRTLPLQAPVAGQLHAGSAAAAAATRSHHASPEPAAQVGQGSC